MFLLVIDCIVFVVDEQAKQDFVVVVIVAIVVVAIRRMGKSYSIFHNKYRTKHTTETAKVEVVRFALDEDNG